jgi:hypothetical protein
MSQPAAASVPELEAQIVAARQRLAATVDELAVRAAPQAILSRQVESTKASLLGAVQTPDGGLRMERVAVIAAAALAFLGLVLMGRRRRR